MELQSGERHGTCMVPDLPMLLDGKIVCKIVLEFALDAPSLES